MKQQKSFETPAERIRVLRDSPIDPRGRYVLYWMTATRRSRWNFGLDRAVFLAAELRVPVLVLEALRIGYRHASRRLHAFVLQGMRDNKEAFQGSPIAYYPYVEPTRGHQAGLLAALASRACAVVTDDWPCFFLPSALEAAQSLVPVRFEAVDSCGIHPIRHTGRLFKTAHSFRRYLQKNLLDWIPAPPSDIPPHKLGLPRLASLPEDIAARWEPASERMLSATPDCLDNLSIDQTVPEVDEIGGRERAILAMRRFVDERLARYDEQRKHPDVAATSELSPFLHFGHISPYEVLFSVLEREEWTPGSLSPTPKGSSAGWWGLSRDAEAFLDQLITWRELGFNMCAEGPKDYASFQSLPEWAQKTLDAHRHDLRPYTYDLLTLEAARTHDPVWNAAQRQLLREGRLHNRLRMLWGKKILEWSSSPEDALCAMVSLNDKYALDGRDPNSYSGIAWCLGRYDRPWAPKRPVFGAVRFMSSANTKRKLKLSQYLSRFAESR